MRIDSHLHLWVNDPENYPWHPIGGYLPETAAPLSHYLEVMDRNGVDGAVLVQPTPYGWDNAYLLHCKQEHPETFRAVVLVDPLSKDASQNLAALFNLGADGLRINWTSNHCQHGTATIFMNSWFNVSNLVVRMFPADA